MLFHLGLGNYRIRDEYLNEMRPVEDMQLIPAIPMDEIVKKVQGEVDPDVEKSIQLEKSPG